MLTYLLQLFPASSVTLLCQENISSINNSFNLPVSKLHSYRGPKDGIFFTPPQVHLSVIQRPFTLSSLMMTLHYHMASFTH